MLIDGYRAMEERRGRIKEGRHELALALWPSGVSGMTIDREIVVWGTSQGDGTWGGGSFGTTISSAAQKW